MKRLFTIFCLSCVLALSAADMSCKKEADKGGDTKADASTMTVQAAGGLRMREAPDVNGKLVVTIPDGSTVTVIERKDRETEVAGKKGRWTKVKWKESTGWAFGGFLVAAGSGQAPSESDYEGKKLSPVLSPDEGADEMDFTLKNGKFTARCLLHGSGEAKLSGTYAVRKEGDALLFTLKGSYESLVVQEREERHRGEFADGSIKLVKKNGKLIGDIILPQCEAFKGRELQTLSSQ